VSAYRTEPTTPRSAAAHVYVESVEDADLEPAGLDPADRHHLERVLRLRSGDVITVGDGRGSWRAMAFGAGLEPVGDVVREPAPVGRIAVGFALVKGDRPELVVRALTEIGVDRIVPLHTERSVVRWNDHRGAEALDRLRRVARAAGMQSRRVWLPEVAGVRTLSELDEPWTMAVPGGPPVGRSCHAVVVGPEGGWTDAELAAGFAPVGLGPHVMRTETAAIAAGALLAAARWAVT